MSCEVLEPRGNYKSRRGMTQLSSFHERVMREERGDLRTQPIPRHRPRQALQMGERAGGTS